MQNWYKLIKLAQVWSYIVDENVDLTDNGDRTFASWLKQLYDLEYKESMVKQHFNGMPQRKENILNNIKINLIEAAEHVVEQLKRTIADWLNKHALLSPATWANERADDTAKSVEEGAYSSFLDGFQTMIGEYVRYKMGKGRFVNVNHNSVWYNLLSEATKHLNKFPTLKGLLEVGFNGYKDYLREEANSNLEVFGEQYGRKFKDITEAEAFIDAIKMEDTDPESFLFSNELEQFLNVAKSYGQEAQVLREFYEYFVFPEWMSYWGAMGIEGTRENVENVYKDLNNISYEDIGNALAIIGTALNLSHQTGEMLDYLQEDVDHEGGEDDIKKILNGLTDGDFVPKANEELKEIGVMVEEKPEQVKSQKQTKVKKQTKQKKVKAYRLDNWYDVAKSLE